MMKILILEMFLKNDIMSIWNNEYYVSARSEFTKTKEMSKFTICNMCKNDTHNPNLFRVGDSFSLTLNRSAQNRVSTSSD